MYSGTSISRSAKGLQKLVHYNKGLFYRNPYYNEETLCYIKVNFSCDGVKLQYPVFLDQNNQIMFVLN